MTFWPHVRTWHIYRPIKNQYLPKSLVVARHRQICLQPTSSQHVKVIKSRNFLLTKTQQRKSISPDFIYYNNHSLLIHFEFGSWPFICQCSDSQSGVGRNNYRFGYVTEVVSVYGKSGAGYRTITIPSIQRREEDREQSFQHQASFYGSLAMQSTLKCGLLMVFFMFGFTKHKKWQLTPLVPKYTSTAIDLIPERTLAI